MRANCSGEEYYVHDYMYMVGDFEMTIPVAFLYVIETVILFFTSFLASVLVVKVDSYLVWHFNINCIIRSYAVGVLLSTFARCVTIYIEIEYRVHEWDCSFSLLFSTVLRIQNYVTHIHLLPIAIIERCFSVVHLNDYERRQRPLIPAILIAFQQAFGFLVAVLQFKNVLQYSYAIMYILVLTVTSLTLLILLWRVNKQKLAQLAFNSEPYSLAKKFQLTENLRVFAMGRSFVMSFVITMIIIVITNFMAIRFFTPSAVSIMLYSIVQSAAPLLTMLFCLQESERWVRQQRKLLGFPPKSAPAIGLTGNEGQIYFEQLATSWNQEPTQQNTKF